MKLLIPLFVVLTLAGCTSIQRALETAERTRESMEAAGAELRDAMEAAENAREEYIATLAQGDQHEVRAALKALRAAEEARVERELKFERTRAAFDQAGAELERAKAENSYIEGVLGLLLGGLIGGGSGFLSGRRRTRD